MEMIERHIIKPLQALEFQTLTNHFNIHFSITSWLRLW